MKKSKIELPKNSEDDLAILDLAIEKKHKLFQSFKVRDIVFLAVISAATLVTCAVMPLVASVPIFGIAQIVTSLQISIFFTIGLCKTRKVGTLLVMALFTGIIQLIMSPPMFLANIVNGIILETVILAIFRGYKSNKAIFLVVALYNPLSLPFNYLYNLAIGNEAVTVIAERAPWLSVVITIAVILISSIGALVGLKIAKELKMAGALK